MSALSGARALVNTSVQDMQSSLPFCTDEDVLLAALAIAEERGQKTRVGLLIAHLRRLGYRQ